MLGAADDGVVAVSSERLVLLPTGSALWGRVFTLAPLVLVGTKEGEGYDLAPKHMAMPLGWDDLYCFVCSARHATYANVVRHPEFTVCFPRPRQILQASLAAGGRLEDGSKPTLAALETVPAHSVDGVLVAGAQLNLECTLDRIVEGFGENSLIVGRVVAASAPEEALRGEETDDADLLHDLPLLAYLAPGRFAAVGESRSFPYPFDFSL